MDDAINSLTRSPNAQNSILKRVECSGRINTGPAPVGVWVIDLGFSIGQIYRRWTRVLNAKADGSIEIHDGEVQWCKRDL